MILSPILASLFVLPANYDGLRRATAFVIIPHEKSNDANDDEHCTEDKAKHGATASSTAIFFDNSRHIDAPPLASMDCNGYARQKFRAGQKPAAYPANIEANGTNQKAARLRIDGGIETFRPSGSCSSCSEIGLELHQAQCPLCARSGHKPRGQRCKITSSVRAMRA
jgi:hypothetical protein